MSRWNPFSRKQEPATPEPVVTSQSGEAAALSQGDDTDPLVIAGAPIERASMVHQSERAWLESVEVLGPSGISDRFIRLTVHDGELATQTRALLESAPEELTGFRHLLANDDEPLVAAFDPVDASLAEAMAAGMQDDSLPRAADLLAGLLQLARLFDHAQ